MKTPRWNYFLFPILLSFMLMMRCGDDSLSPHGDSIGGTITFTDDSYLSGNGYYAVCLFPAVAYPYCQQPVRIDSLHPASGNTTLSYLLSNVAAGRYYVGVAWVPEGPSTPPTNVLGTYGCNTDNMSQCSAYKMVEIPSYSGTGNISFTSWTHRNNYINNACP